MPDDTPSEHEATPDETTDPADGLYQTDDRAAETSELPSDTKDMANGTLSANPVFNMQVDQMVRDILGGMQEHNKETMRSFRTIVSNVISSSDQLDGARAVLREMTRQPSLSQPRDFQRLDPARGSYSEELESPGTFFESTERQVDSFDDLHKAITELMTKTTGIPLVWRGVADADWGLYSSLYRHLLEWNKVKRPQLKPRGDQPYPDENQMVAAEKEILRLARSDWRFDDLSALETFARVQHVGGPTRLIDVTKNPYVGAWFAVEHSKRHEEKDARLFALATKPVPRDGHPAPPNGSIQLDDFGASRDPFWHLLTDSDSRQRLDWGTGARRRIWVPPTYDPRIAAQNAAFILDGVPMTSSKTSSYFKIPGTKPIKYWKRADLLAASSIYTKMSSPTKTPRPYASNFSPTFSFRITAKAKREIREVLESRFGYRTSYIYPDMQALADHLSTQRLAAPPAKS